MGNNREQEDAARQLFESNGWPWDVEVTYVCETESTALSVTRQAPPICIQIILTSKLLSLEIRQNSLSSTQ